MKTLSCIIPVRPGEFPTRALEHLRKVDYPLDRIEVLVVEGRQPSRQRNQAVMKARGEVLYFLDDDSFVDPASIKEGLRFLEDPQIGAVGGPALTYEAGSWLEKCFGEVVGAYWGGFITRYRHRSIGEARRIHNDALILCNLMMRKECFLVMSGLADHLYPGEEPEFLKRVRKEGYLLYYNPGMIVRRTRSASLGAFIRQSFNYSVGRARHLFYNWKTADLVFLLPSVFAAYLLALPFARSPWCFAPAILYGALVTLNALWIAVTRLRPDYLPALPPLFLLMHLSYGAGMVAGLIRVRRSLRGKPPPITISTIDLAASP